MSNTGAGAESGYASVSRRLGAYGLDALVVLLAYALSLVLGPASLPGLLCSLVALAYGVVMWLGVGLQGRTPAMRVVGIRVADPATAAPIGVLRALLRQLVLGVLGPVNVVQLFLIPHQPRRQGWHDLVAGSVVLEAAPGGSPTPPAGSTISSATVPRPSLATPAPGPAPAPAPPPIGPVPAAAPSGMIAPPPGIVPPPPPPPPVASTPVAPAGREPVSETVISPRVPAPAPVPPQPAAAPTWRLVGPSGETTLTGRLITGRDPDATLVPGATAWSLSDPGLTVSKTHALFGLDGAAAWVEDWASTNGVLLRRGADEHELPPHERTPLQDGDEVLLGDFALKVEGGR